MKMRAKYLSLLLLVAMPTGCKLNLGGEGKSSASTGGGNNQFTEPEPSDAQDVGATTASGSASSEEPEAGEDGTEEGDLPGGELPGGTEEEPEEKTSDEASQTGEEPSEEPSEEEPKEESEPPECEEGAEKSCLETPDGEAIDFPTGVPLGNCKAGTKICADGAWGSCEGAIIPEKADSCEIAGDDANCDGSANGGCDCVDGESRPCGQSDKGQCKMGTQTCVGGKWPEDCAGAVYPETEKCDGKNLDEDCDGTVDLEDGDCNCIDGTVEFCERPNQRGDCKWGRRSCTEGQWSGCQEWAKAQDEVCGTRPAQKGLVWTGDENCDGRVDSSAFGKRGPQGCRKMMLDQDGDGYGKMGKDLSEISNASELALLATACLCAERPDIEQKKAEGWVPFNGKERKDCGDCAGDKGGDDVYPGSDAFTSSPNACLKETRWMIRKDSSPQTGYFDLNCDGKHKDPNNENGKASKIKCKFNKKKKTCSAEGKGRLIVTGANPLRCGGTYEYGKCKKVTKKVEDSESSEAKEEVVGCEVKPAGGKYVVNCQ